MLHPLSQFDVIQAPCLIQVLWSSVLGPFTLSPALLVSGQSSMSQSPFTTEIKCCHQSCTDSSSIESDQYNGKFGIWEICQIKGAKKKKQNEPVLLSMNKSYDEIQPVIGVIEKS